MIEEKWTFNEPFKMTFACGILSQQLTCHILICTTTKFLKKLCHYQGNSFNCVHVRNSNMCRSWNLDVTSLKFSDPLFFHSFNNTQIKLLYSNSWALRFDLVHTLENCSVNKNLSPNLDFRNGSYVRVCLLALYGTSQVL